jgi:hypothetical protein
MDTIREIIIKALVAQAAVIRTTGSPVLYSTDCGATVLRERRNVDPSELPCIVIWPQREEAANTHGQTRIRMTVQIDGVMKFNDDDPSVVSEKILGDIVKCFATPGWFTTSPNYIESMVYQSGGNDSPRDESAITVGMAATFLLTYWTAAGDPYSL